MKINHQNLLFTVLLLVFIWSSALVKITGWPWLWGMIPWGKEIAAWVIPAAIMCTALLFEKVITKLESSSLTIFNYLERDRSRVFRNIVFILAMVSSALIAWCFRSRNYFLGDGWAFVEKVTGPFYFYTNEPLDFFIHQSFQRFLKLLGINGGEYAYAILHCLLLPVFLIVCWKIATILVTDFFKRLMFFTLIISTSSMQLFFGYVESYILIHLLIAIYLFYSLKHLKLKFSKYPWLPTLIFLLALSTHRIVAVLFPSLLYLWLEKYSSRGWRWKISPSILILAIGCITMAAIYIKTKFGFLVPVSGPIDGADNPYHLLDIKHVWDKFNFLLLICPATVIIFFVLLIEWRNFGKLKTSSVVFAFWSAAGCSFFSFAVDPDLGIRDWDLFSLPAVPLAVFNGLTLLKLLHPESKLKSILGILAIMSAVNVSTWIWVNADMDRGVRFIDHVRFTDFHRGSDRVQLGYLLDERGYSKEALRQYKMAEGEWSFKATINGSTEFVKLGMPDSAIYYTQVLLNTLKSKNMALDPNGNAMSYCNLSIAYDMAGLPDSASKYFIKTMEISFPPPKIEQLWLNKMKETAEKMGYFQKIKDNPKDAELILFSLRYHVIEKNASEIAKDYRLIFNKDFALSDFKKFINFAKVCKHNKIEELIIQAIKSEYPNIDIDNYLSD